MAIKVNRPIPVGMGEVSWNLNLVNDPEPIVMTMGLDFATQPTVADCNALFTALKVNFNPRIGNSYILTSVHVLYQSDATHQIAVDSTNLPGNFENVGQTLPQNTAILVKKLTVFAGRKFRGRMYVPGIPEADVNNNGLIVANFANWQTAANGFLTAVSAVGIPQLFHSCEYDDAGPPCLPEGPTTVTALVVDQTVATQRRRLR